MKQLGNLSRAVLGGALFLSTSSILTLRAPALAHSDSTTTGLENRRVELAQNRNNRSQFQTLAEADKLYLRGDKAKAEKLYRQVKTPFSQEAIAQLPQPFSEPEKLSPAGRVYWRIAKAGFEQNLESKIFVPLEGLIREQPHFIPAYPLLYQALQERQRNKEALEVLEKAVAMFPDSLELTKTHIKALEAEKQWLEASVAARQFALVNPGNPEAAELVGSADRNLSRFQSELKQQMLISGILGGVIGFVTGDGGARALQLAPLMLMGESGMGQALAEEQKQKLKLVEDPEVVEYVSEIGKKLALLMGRDFNYEFYVVQDKSLNAFALPGGKVFVNTGTILNTNSEAELAGVMAHEVSHAVLSHGFQRIVTGNLLANLRQIIPFGDVISGLVVLDYSRENERQSDIVGTRVLTAAGYASDGLRNFMVTLSQQHRQSAPAWISTHPVPTDRVTYLEALIQRNGYSRYSFEGVEKHAAIQKRVKTLMSHSGQQALQGQQVMSAVGSRQICLRPLSTPPPPTCKDL